MNDIFYYETGSTWPPYNLALEEMLCQEVANGGSGCFLLWQNSPSVIIGRNQNSFTEVNLCELRRRKFHLIRRMTGGGAVYHDAGNLNFTFIIPMPLGQKPNIKETLAPLIGALSHLGITAVIGKRNELTIPGHSKISGTASRRLNGVWHFHGTLLYDVDFEPLETLLYTDQNKYQSKGVASVRSQVTNLKDHTDISLTDLWSKIRDAYGYPVAMIADELKEAAQQLVDTKYGLDSWNIAQSPPSDIIMTHSFSFGSLTLKITTSKNTISAAKLSGDGLTYLNHSEPSSVEKLENTLIGLAVDQPLQWAKAWEAFDLQTIISNKTDQAAMIQWLTEE